MNVHKLVFRELAHLWVSIYCSSGKCSLASSCCQDWCQVLDLWKAGKRLTTCIGKEGAICLISLFPQHLLTEEENHAAHKRLDLGSSDLSGMSPGVGDGAGFRTNNLFEPVFSLPHFYWGMTGFPSSSTCPNLLLLPQLHCKQHRSLL